VGLLIDKFRYHLPLYRQHQRMQAAGLTISRSSLSNWVHRTIELLEPIYHSQLYSILHSRVLAMDETPIRAGRKSKGKMRTAYFWPIYGDQHEVAFPYAPSRAHDHATSILGEYCGTLITDGYPAYDDYAARRDEVVHAQCWVHVRRGFVKAEDVEPEGCGEAIRRIGELCQIEKEIREAKLAGEAKQKVRGEKSKLLVTEFFEWLQQELIGRTSTEESIYQGRELCAEAEVGTRSLSRGSRRADGHESSGTCAASHSHGPKKLVVLLDRDRGGKGRPDPESHCDLRSSRHRSLHVPRRRSSENRHASPITSLRTDATALEREVGRQPDAIDAVSLTRIASRSRADRQLWPRLAAYFWALQGRFHAQAARAW
jgi:hypothetical protein